MIDRDRRHLNRGKPCYPRARRAHGGDVSPAATAEGMDACPGKEAATVGVIRNERSRRGGDLDGNAIAVRLQLIKDA
jgi:hypothetical protein